MALVDQLYVLPFWGLANPTTPSFITAWEHGCLPFSEGTEIITVGLVAACTTVCTSVSGLISICSEGPAIYEF